MRAMEYDGEFSVSGRSRSLSRNCARWGDVSHSARSNMEMTDSANAA